MRVRVRLARCSPFLICALSSGSILSNLVRVRVRVRGRGRGRGRVGVRVRVRVRVT